MSVTTEGGDNVWLWHGILCARASDRAPVATWRKRPTVRPRRRARRRASLQLRRHGPPAAQPQAEQQLLKPEQLEALVAPIALYPDELLAKVLAASTYPLEAVQADRWVKANKSLKGER